MDPRLVLWRRLREFTGADLPAIDDDPLGAEVRLLVEYEKLARRIDTFEPFVIPGLLQTRAYAEVALGLFVAPPALERQVAARLSRRSLLDRPDGPLLRFLIDESALLRWPGSAIRDEQIGRLVELAGHPRVDVRVMPFGAGPHEGVKGPLVVCGFDDPRLPDLVYLEDAKGDVIRAGAEEVQPFAARFERLLGAAVPMTDYVRS